MLHHNSIRAGTQIGGYARTFTRSPESSDRGSAIRMIQ
jgi:hypothetical protein